MKTQYDFTASGPNQQLAWSQSVAPRELVPLMDALRTHGYTRIQAVPSTRS